MMEVGVHLNSRIANSSSIRSPGYWWPDSGWAAMRSMRFAWSGRETGCYAWRLSCLARTCRREHAGDL